MQQKRGLASRWASTNPVLLAGELGVETDTNLMKIGNGTDPWNDLAYVKTDTGQIAYTHVQNATASEWHIFHNLSFEPNVRITNVNGLTIEADILHVSATEIKVTLSQEIIGFAYLS